MKIKLSMLKHVSYLANNLISLKNKLKKLYFVAWLISMD